MAQEIERRFLVSGDTWRNPDEGTYYRQGYLSTDPERIVRVRTCNNKGFLTIKGITQGFTRSEFEYEIPFAEAVEMLDNLCGQAVIEKIRYHIIQGNLTWEIDEFHGANAGLILAEIELTREDEVFELPEWIDREISDDPRYFNSHLVLHPFCTWDQPTE